MVCVNAKRKHCRGGNTQVRRDVKSILSPTSNLDRNTRQYAHTVEGAVAGKYTGDAGEAIQLGTGLKPFQYQDNLRKIGQFFKDPKDIPRKVGQGIANIATGNHYVQAARDVGNVFKDPGNARNWGRLAMNIPAVNLGVATGRFVGGLFSGGRSHSASAFMERQRAARAEAERAKEVARAVRNAVKRGSVAMAAPAA